MSEIDKKKETGEHFKMKHVMTFHKCVKKCYGWSGPLQGESIPLFPTSSLWLFLPSSFFSEFLDWNTRMSAALRGFVDSIIGHTWATFDQNIETHLAAIWSRRKMNVRFWMKHYFVNNKLHVTPPCKIQLKLLWWFKLTTAAVHKV